jgi:hypothetical protein
VSLKPSTSKLTEYYRTSLSEVIIQHLEKYYQQEAREEKAPSVIVSINLKSVLFFGMCGVRHTNEYDTQHPSSSILIERAGDENRTHPPKKTSN